MKNRNIQFKPTAGVLIPLLLACFAAVFISATTPASASDQVPFKATFTGSSTSGPGAPCAVLRSDITGGGHATHLGNFTTVQHHCFDPGDPTGAFTEGFYTFTGANGDTIFGTYHGNLFPLLRQYSQSSENSRSREGQVDSLARPEEALHRARLMSRQASPR